MLAASAAPRLQLYEMGTGAELGFGIRDGGADVPSLPVRAVMARDPAVTQSGEPAPTE